MKSTIVWSLAALNVLLLVMFVARMTGENTAVAQAKRAPGDYLMIPGEILGANNAVVYVLDQSEHSLSAMSYDDGNRKLVTMPPLNLDREMAEVGGRRNPR